MKKLLSDLTAPILVLAAIATIMALIVQVFSAEAQSEAQATQIAQLSMQSSAQSTQIALQAEQNGLAATQVIMTAKQLELQQQIRTPVAGETGFAPTATTLAVNLAQVEGTRQALNAQSLGLSATQTAVAQMLIQQQAKPPQYIPPTSVPVASIPQFSGYCYGKCWQYDDNARTMTWTGPTDGREDIWQGDTVSLSRIRSGWIAIFGPVSVPGEIEACVLTLNGQSVVTTCNGVQHPYAVAANSSYRVTSQDPGVGGFRWKPAKGYGYRTGQ